MVEALRWCCRPATRRDEGLRGACERVRLPRRQHAAQAPVGDRSARTRNGVALHEDVAGHCGWSRPATRRSPPGPFRLMSRPVERAVVFGCEGEELLGVLHEPASDGATGTPASTGVIIVVGGPQYRVGSHRQFVLMARELARRGHAVLRFD